jgi:hypothetical protein
MTILIMYYFLTVMIFLVCMIKLLAERIYDLFDLDAWTKEKASVEA